MGSCWSDERREPYWKMLLHLVGHLIGTALIFVTFFTLAWALSALVGYLHGIHALPGSIYGLVAKIEVFIVYADAALCGTVLLASMWRFVRGLL